MALVYEASPGPPHIGTIDSAVLLRKMVSQAHTIQLLAKYTHQVLALFDAAPIYVLTLPVEWMIT